MRDLSEQVELLREFLAARPEPAVQEITIRVVHAPHIQVQRRRRPADDSSRSPRGRVTLSLSSLLVLLFVTMDNAMVALMNKLRIKASARLSLATCGISNENEYLIDGGAHRISRPRTEMPTSFNHSKRTTSLAFLCGLSGI